MSLRPMRAVLIAAAGTVALLFSASSALAHAHLESSVPAAEAVVASPSMITLHFTEALELRFSGFEITDARGARVNALSSADPNNPAVLMATPAAALSPGVYHVTWHIVAHDGHRMRGAYDFTVH